MSKLITEIAQHAAAYYAREDVKQVSHTAGVAYFTTLIARGEGYTEHRAMLLEITALLHDIGCPNARIHYGNSLPVRQEAEGKILVPEFLKETDGLTAEEEQWIADVVGTHHQQRFALSLHFEALFDADLIENLLEGYYPLSKAETYYKMILTETGKKLYRNLFTIKP
jgi:hypothetical protein